MRARYRAIFMTLVNRYANSCHSFKFPFSVNALINLISSPDQLKTVAVSHYPLPHIQTDKILTTINSDSNPSSFLYEDKTSTDFCDFINPEQKCLFSLIKRSCRHTFLLEVKLG
jgi:hypothetical protein